MRKVKCKICGNELTNDVAYKVKIGKVNNYYCTKEEYEDLQKQKQTKEECMVYVQQMLGLPLLPPMMIKEINRVSKSFDYIVIQKTFKECESKIKWFLEGASGSFDYPKARYIITIIENNINSVFKKHKHEQEQMKRLFEIQKDKEIEVDLFNISNKPTTTSKVTDISEFLD